ncbi:MAG: haloacid dehalogenase-like hydrolase [Thermoleophilia bacterium]|jgi:phosphoserine phosphatase|nr:haloacid dehalogenase-like hydrolase [Thermoleophilia bacterium]
MNCTCRSAAGRNRVVRQSPLLLTALLVLASTLSLGCHPSSGTVTTSQLLHLAQNLAVKPGHAPCAVFDADGTLWDFDLSEALVKRTLADRTASDAGLPAMNATLAAFGLPTAATVYEATRAIDAALASGALLEAGRRRGWDEAEVATRVWPHYNWLYAGLAPAAVSARADKLLATGGYRERVFDGMRAVVAVLRARGFKLFVISGGVHEFATVGAAAFGFAPAEVRGLKLKVRDGRLTDEVVPPVPYQGGKATLARELCGGPPMFAFGDSVAAGDAAMLAAAAVPVAVRPQGRHLETAKRRRMLIYARPEAGPW